MEFLLSMQLPHLVLSRVDRGKAECIIGIVRNVYRLHVYLDHCRVVVG